MANGNIYFEIQADDTNRAISFYKSVFGWEFALNPHAPIEYYHIEKVGPCGGLLKRPAQVPPKMCGTNAFCCSLEVDDFDSFSAKIIENGGIVALPKMAIAGTCWQGYFLDPEGNVFGIFQVDENAK